MSKFKTRKIRHLRGRKTGFGNTKKHRGSGSRGGKGLAGLHKYKWSWTTTFEPDHFKKPSMKPKPRTYDVINLHEINDMAVKRNLKEIDLPHTKVLGDGEITKAIKVKALAFSKTAEQKIKEAGGTAQLVHSNQSSVLSKEPVVKPKTEN
ncbi:TPA: uL15 family ribosomal protein [archaeon]|nr:uL15 family ribosomal protein [Candidatus Naiadarchaeales archaeon SRR2090153.bin461]